MADRIKGITIEIGGDTTGLNKALSGTNKEIRNTQSQLKDVERLLKLDPSNTELLQQKQKLLSDAVNETGDKLEKLKTAEKQAQNQFKEGKISEEQYNALKREIIATEQQLEKLEDQAEKSSVALQKLGIAGEKMKEFGGKVTAAGQELSKVSAGLAAVGAASVAAWETVDDAYDTIAKGTGATGEALADLQKSFDNVFSSIPTDAATAGGAIADINTRFGFTGEVLEDCTKKFIQFGEVNNTDVSTAIANVSRYMGDANIESTKYGEVLDQLTAASQASGLGVDKLSESLTKYGAPMRALGLTTKESIAILAGWEKAGVNTEIAFSGMKKAIGTWAKEGKDASQEFKKTLAEIAAAPDIAEATTKAIEVFGQKAGPDLADAIQGGRFEYEDFLDVIEKSDGQLEQTFSDTLDPIDDVKVSMQELTTQGAKLGGELLKALAPMITKLVDKLKELTSWFEELDDSQKETVVKIGLLVAAIGPLLVIIGQVSTGVGALTIALSGAGGPILLAVTALGAFAGALYKAKSNSDEYYRSLSNLNESEQANKDKVDELTESYAALAEKRQGTLEDIDAQSQHERELWEELQNITDENGNIQEGQESRAKFITGELSSALGLEIDIIDDQIQGYKNLSAQIDAVIEKKQQEATLAAFEEEYRSALKDKSNAQEEYTKALSNSKAATEEYNAAVAEREKKERELNEALSNFGKENSASEDEIERMAWAYQELQNTETALKEHLDEVNETLSKSESAWTGVNTTIQNYEGAAAAIIGGDQQEIGESLSRLTHDFQTAETGTRESLEAQCQSYKTQLDEAREVVKSGATGIADDYVAELVRLELRARQELAKVPEAAGESVSEAATSVQKKSGEMEAVGNDFSKGFLVGMLNGQPAIESAAIGMASAGVEAARKALDSHSPSREMQAVGNDYATGFSGGIAEKTSEVVTSADHVAESAANSLKINIPQADIWGSDMMAGYIRGIKSKVSELEQACQSVAGTVSDYMHFTRPERGPLRNYEEWMPHMMQGLAKGITDNVGVVGAAAGSAAGKIGEELAAGIADGVRQNKDNAKKSAEDLAKAILSAAQKKLKNEQVYREISLADEVDYWNAVRKQMADGTEARISADEKYFKAKQSLNKKAQAAEEKYTNNVAKAYENLNKEIKQLNQEYRNAVDSRTSEIRDAFGLFDEFSADTDQTSDQLLNNLQSQVDGLKDWRDNLNTLEKRGIGDELLAELQDLGPQSAAQVKLLTQMTDDQLTKYVNLFRQKNRIARKQAVDELAPMRDDITDQIAELKRQTAKELESYQKEYMDSMAELGVALNQPAENLKLTMAQNAVEMVSTLATSIQTEAGNAENTARFKAIAQNILNSTGTLPTDMQGVGQNTIAGIITGLQNKEAELYAAAQSIAQRVTQAMQDAFGIHSPSVVMREQIGKNLMLGLQEGMEKYKKLATSAVSIGMNFTGTAERDPGAGAEDRGMADVVGLLNAYLPEIAQQKYIALDGKTLVGQTVGTMDRQLAGVQRIKGRIG